MSSRPRAPGEGPRQPENPGFVFCGKISRFLCKFVCRHHQSGMRMKEQYFSPETIETESEAMIGEVKNYSGVRTFQPKSGKMALLVVDMQYYFLKEDEHAFIPSAPVILPNILKLMKACRSLLIPVILTRHLNTYEDAGMMGIRWNELIKADDARSEIHADILSMGGEVLEKSQFDAFYKTGLEEKLRQKGIEQLIICGVMTNLCCETTARSAFVHGFDVVMPVDATAAYNYEFHLATFLNLSYMFARPMNTFSLINKLLNA
jgi:nicotinamidase-related amidase